MEPKTWNDLVRGIWGDISEEQVDLLLWETTSFPMGDVDHVKKQLTESYKQSNGDVNKAIAIAYDEIDKYLQEQRFWDALTNDYENKE